MGTVNTPHKGRPSACSEIPSHPPVEIPRVLFDRQWDRLMTVQRLALALHRVSAKGAPENLLAWEIFLAIHGACDTLGNIAGYSPDEREPE